MKSAAANRSVQTRTVIAARLRGRSYCGEAEARLRPSAADFGEAKERRKRAAVIMRTLKRLIPDAGKGTVLHYSNPWKLLVAVELSAQCTDKKVNEVTRALFKKYRTLDDYVRARPAEFERDIRPTGFYRSKAKNILAAAKVVKEHFHGRLPKTMAEMITIPGVGRKSANVILGNAYGVVEGIAVDTHVRRLSRLLGLTDHNDPVKIERDLMAIVPKKDWFLFTYLLVEYGRRYCPSRPHQHAECPLAVLLKPSGA
jgi:endonuclease-3